MYKGIICNETAMGCYWTWILQLQPEKDNSPLKRDHREAFQETADVFAAGWRRKTCARLWKMALIILGMNIAQRGGELPVWRSCTISAGPAQFHGAFSLTFVHLCSRAPQTYLGSVPFHAWPQVPSLLSHLTAAREQPTAFSTSVLSAFVLVLSVLWQRNNLDRFVGCLAC